MQFTTAIPIQKSNFPIDYNSKIVSLGSCFAEHIGAKLAYYKFQTTTNPFGILFSAVAIEKLLERVIHKAVFTEKDIFFHNELWHCFEVHSDCSHPDKAIFLNNLNRLLEDCFQQIQQATHFMITYGTSWVYKNIEDNQIVANCHKIPQKQFSKMLLSSEANVKAIENTIALLTSVNKKSHFIFTVSPVRHIIDGYFENNVSKSHLLAAIYQVISNQDDKSIYFPSYEIMIDELRDYRFYAEDLLHPNATAIAYIWERFIANYASEATFSTLQKIEVIQKGLAHRPFNSDTKQHQEFVVQLQNRILEIQKQLPHIVF